LIKRGGVFTQPAREFTLAELGATPPVAGAPIATLADSGIHTFAEVWRAVRSALIAKRSTSILEVTKASRADFAMATYHTLGDFKAAQVHEMAGRKFAFLNNIATSIRGRHREMGRQPNFSDRNPDRVLSPSKRSRANAGRW